MANGSMRRLYSVDAKGKKHVRAYKVEWTSGSRSRSKTFDVKHKTVAEKFLAGIRLQTAMEKAGIQAPVETTLREFFEGTFWKGKAQSASKTQENALSCWNKWINPALGDKQMKDVTIDDIENLLTNMTGGGLTETPKKVRYLLISIWGLAVRRDVVSRNVAQEARIIVQQPAFDLSDDEESDDIDAVYDVLSVGDVRSIVTHIHPAFRTLVQVLANTGMRGGEAVALRVNDFDPVKGQIRISKSWSSAKAGVGKSGTKRPKTMSSVRTIPLKKDMVELLKKQVEGRKPSDPIFTSVRGCRLDMQNFARRDWSRAREASGVSANFTPHALRHFAASQMLRTESVQVVYRYIGHASPAVTQRIYSHFIPESNAALLQAVEAMPDLAPMGSE